MADSEQAFRTHSPSGVEPEAPALGRSIPDTGPARLCSTRYVRPSAYLDQQRAALATYEAWQQSEARRIVRSLLGLS